MRMKIVHIEDYFDPTAGYQINELLYASKNFNDDVYLITSKDMTPFHKKFDVDEDRDFEQSTGVKIYRLESVFKISSRLILKNLAKVLNEINPDVVFMHGIGDFKDLQLWMKKPNYKIVRDCHMSWIASKNKFRHIFYYMYRLMFASIINRTNKYDVIYALGDEEYEYLKKIGIEDNKIDYLPHGYNESIMYYDETERNNIREKYKIAADDIVISYIGKFNYSKRPDLIIDIINRFDEKYIITNKLKLLFIGPKENIYMKEFNEKLEKIDKKIPIIIDDSKSFDELRKYYSASDICIFPKETTLSSIHAQVCGCPVIMEDYKSNRERVVTEDNLYKVDNFEQASNILKKILENKDYEKNNVDKLLLENREYKNQVKKLKSRINPR